MSEPTQPQPGEPDERAQAERLIAEAEAFLAASAGTSRHTVKIGVWEQRLYRETVTVHTPLRQVVDGFEEGTDYAEELLTDVFAYLWLSQPQILPRKDVLPSRWENLHVLTCMSRSLEVAELRSATVHDEIATAMAVVWLSESIRAWLAQQPLESDPDFGDVLTALGELHEALEQLDGVGVALGEAMGKLAEALEAAQGEAGDIDDLDESARGASVEFEEMREMAGLLGLSSRGDTVGEGPGMSSAATWNMLKRLRSTQISRYADLVGRFVSVATSGIASSPVPHGVELSDRLWDADAAELATRHHRKLRLEHLERVAAGELITDAYTGRPEKAGPMVLVVDESSSMLTMSGDVPRMVWAKAFVLAMVQQCRDQRRRCVVISFASRRQVRIWENVVVDPEELVSFLEHDFCGGTAYEEPLDAALTVVERYPQMRAADIVLITDDDRADVPAGWLTRWRERRDAVKPVPPRLRGVGVSVRPGAWLSRVTDDVVLINDFTSERQVGSAARGL